VRAPETKPERHRYTRLVGLFPLNITVYKLATSCLVPEQPIINNVIVEQIANNHEQASFHGVERS
jgi:hypothetical protein